MFQLNELAYCMHLFKNDLHYMHLHALGEDFDKIHSITEELYKEAEKEIDDLSELALMAEFDIKNFNCLEPEDFNFLAKEGLKWVPVTDSTITWNVFTQRLQAAGLKIISIIRSTNCNLDSVEVEDYLIDILKFWEKVIYYKNSARLYR